MAFCVKDHPRPTSGMLGKTRGWMGFSDPGEGKIDYIVLTSKQTGPGIQNFVVFVNTQTIIKSPLIQINLITKISGEVLIEKNFGRGLCLVKLAHSPGEIVNFTSPILWQSP